MTETQNAYIAIRAAIQDSLYEAKATTDAWDEFPLLLTLDMIETYALKMMWTS